MDLNMVCLLPNRYGGEPGSHVANTGRKLGLAAFAVVNLKGCSGSARPKFGAWLTHE
jgi:hypothetical protein